MGGGGGVDVCCGRHFELWFKFRHIMASKLQACFGHRGEILLAHGRWPSGDWSRGSLGKSLDDGPEVRQKKRFLALEVWLGVEVTLGGGGGVACI